MATRLPGTTRYEQLPSPCEIGIGCAHQAHCAKQLKSCVSFDRYLETGIPTTLPLETFPVVGLFGKQFLSDPASDLRSSEAKQQARLRERGMRARPNQ